MKRLVLASIETSDGGRCVDLFERSDGGFGFEEYRRDPEDARGWAPAGGFADLVYETRDEAAAAAEKAVSWLEGRLMNGGGT